MFGIFKLSFAREPLDSEVERQDKFYRIIIKAEAVVLAAANTSNDFSNDSSVLSVKETYAVPQIRLPLLDIPIFSSLYEDWTPYKEVFTAIIDKNTPTDDVHKLYYLRQSLKGGIAAKITNAVDLSSHSYKYAWDSLVSRFQNERVIFERHIKAIFDQQNIERESSSSLRHLLLDNTTVHLKALSALKQPIEH
ncbi:uncharacterized protein LOC142317837 [Lycorma delicatula]|uniref:uncharacterized protein LOC142317837 n=1 Tax=Lycorma delicatula TaxID=130591 RepID=UPI003F51AA20